MFEAICSAKHGCLYCKSTVTGQRDGERKPVGGAGGDVGFRKERQREKFLTVQTWPLRKRHILSVFLLLPQDLEINTLHRATGIICSSSQMDYYLKTQTGNSSSDVDAGQIQHKNKNALIRILH